ncbi:MAG TPA: helix-hairpin-helix domain-containing protein [Pyrinomonadaceae bacterium]
MSKVISSNASVATKLDEVARLLEDQDANPFRVAAYKRAATTIRELDRPLEEILQKEGLAGLDKLPGVGETIASIDPPDRDDRPLTDAGPSAWRE